MHRKGTSMASDLVGLQEVAELARVTSSAVANWRRRFPDFPAPIVELKSGPVFSGEQVQAWLNKRQSGDLAAPTRYYDQLSTSRGDAPELVKAIEETVSRLADEETSAGRPGVLLGKVQS